MKVENGVNKYHESDGNREICIHFYYIIVFRFPINYYKHLEKVYQLIQIVMTKYTLYQNVKKLCSLNYFR